MEVLGDLVARDRRAEAPALRVPAAGRTDDYRRFCTTAWKAGNFLRQVGVSRGATVAVADDRAPEAVLTLYGAACVGGVVRFDAESDWADPPRALVVPPDGLGADAIAPPTTPVVYGEPSADPTVASFGRDVWSQNPTVPPEDVDPADGLLETDRQVYTHREVLDAAAAVVDGHGVDADTAVAVDPDASLASPGIVVAGLVAPILAGGTVAIGPAATGDLVVGPEADLDAAAVLGGP